jgi:hypothetical protein
LPPCHEPRDSCEGVSAPPSSLPMAPHLLSVLPRSVCPAPPPVPPSRRSPDGTHCTGKPGPESPCRSDYRPAPCPKGEWGCTSERWAPAPPAVAAAVWGDLHPQTNRPHFADLESLLTR